MVYIPCSLSLQLRLFSCYPPSASLVGRHGTHPTLVQKGAFPLLEVSCVCRVDVLALAYGPTRASICRRRFSLRFFLVLFLSLEYIRTQAIRDSQQPVSPIGFVFLKLPPPPCPVPLEMCPRVLDIKSFKCVGWVFSPVEV